MEALRTEVAAGVRQIVGYRLGLYDPDPEADDLTLFGDLYSDSAKDRLVLKLTMDRFRVWAGHESDVEQCMGVFPVYR